MDTKKVTLAILSTIAKIAVTVLVLMFIYKGAVWAYDFGYCIFEDKPVAEAPGREVTVSITEGMGAKEIGQVLETKGLVEDATIFYLQNLLSATKDELQPGMYTLNTSMSAKQMMDIMARQEEETGEDT